MYNLDGYFFISLWHPGSIIAFHLSSLAFLFKQIELQILSFVREGKGCPHIPMFFFFKLLDKI